MASLMRHSSWQNMLCWGFTAVSFGCCILVLFSLLSSLTEKLLYVLWSADWLWYLKSIRFLCLQTLLGCFCNVFRIIIHLHCKTLSSSEFRNHIIRSSVNTSSLHAITLTDDVVWFGSCFLFFTAIFSSHLNVASCTVRLFNTFYNLGLIWSFCSRCFVLFFRYFINPFKGKFFLSIWPIPY